MAIKLPHVVDQYDQRRRARLEECEQRLRWEKTVLSNLRGACSVYLPRYYHTVQEHSDYRTAVIMDYLPGPTLHERLILQRATMTAGAQLHLVSHIANALSFLESYRIAHLDLTPANVIIHNELPKLIDFGEAYSPDTASHYWSKKEKLHVPGRTFPYAPPETTLRQEGFTTAQDVFSLGVILMQMFYGISLPSREVLQRR
jgi:serine/threonine protein kinase